jgi:hypothetical protein
MRRMCLSKEGKGWTESFKIEGAYFLGKLRSVFIYGTAPLKPKAGLQGHPVDLWLKI